MLSYWTPEEEKNLNIRVGSFEHLHTVPGAVSIGQYLLQLPQNANSELRLKQFTGKALHLNQDGSLFTRQAEGDQLIRMKSP